MIIFEMIARGWDNFLARSDGPLNLRFIMQPTIAMVMALRAGIKDAKAHKPPYLWAALTDPKYRWQLVHGGWKDMRVTFFVSAAFDVIYQVIVHHAVYPLELLFTATLLALIPYFMLRGPVNRLAQRFYQTNTQQ